MRPRDFVVIPLISLATLAVLALASEGAARLAFEEGGSWVCQERDPATGERLKLNCSARAKSAEGPWVGYRYNDCGFRNPESCGERPPGRLRIAMLGASTAQGYKVRYEDGVGARTAAQLTQACGREVEVQNLGVPGYSMLDSYRRMPQALALKPDAIVLVISPYELVDMASREKLARRKEADAPATAVPAAPAATPPKARNLIVEIDAMVANARAATAAQHFLYQDRARYIDLFLMHGDKADYLRQPLSAKWEQRLADVELMLGEMVEAGRAQNVPVVLLFGPQRIQAALLDPRWRPPGVDPEAIVRRVADVAQRTGAVMVDVLGNMRGIAQPELLYYPVDGHMTGAGHNELARALVEQLKARRVGAFAACGGAS